MTKTQLAVIGAGPGGYVAAFKAADLGLDVTLIDPDPKPGGVCLYRGCIPSKALLHVCKLLNEAREAEAWGIRFGEPEIDLKRLRAFKDRVVARMSGGLGQLAKARKVNFIRGRARFVDGRTLSVDSDAEDGLQLQFENAVVATGSRPATLPVFDIGGDRVMDSTGALELADVPARLLVVGGGAIGVELGSVYASLGSAVSVVEMMPGLVPPADRDLVKPLHDRLEELCERILVDTTVSSVRAEEDALHVAFQPREGEPFEESYDKLLVAVGRTPNSDGLGLENTRAKVDGRGCIEVDHQRRTGEPSIFAIGDVIGSGLAHSASHEGTVAAEVIAGRRVAFEPNAIPNIVYTDPEIAWCGVTEEEARAGGLDVDITRFPWGASGRATTQDRNDGLTKLILDKPGGRVLGVGVAGAGAGELIAEGVLAVEMAALASDLSHSIHPHPTLSETLMEAAELFGGHSPHLAPGKR